MVAALAAGWIYRDRLREEVGTRLGMSPPASSTVVARPGTRALASAREKIDSLNGWRADSVVLTPSEVASLIGAGLAPALRGRLDSLYVRPRVGELVVGARLETEGLPRDLVGPLTPVLQPTEPIEAAGPLEVVGPGRAEWEVRGFALRGIPIPRPLISTLAERAFGQAERRKVPIRIPAGIRRIRFRSFGAIVYGGDR